ncbi:MAG: response regulator transcription factor [Pirellulales bacterium]
MSPPCRANTRGAKILLLDDVANDGRVLLTLRTDARGYLTTRQSGDEIVSAIRRAAVGERVFTPEIASRLTITPEGIRLKSAADEGPLTGLTPREREVMTYLSLGYTVKQTAATLGLQPSTVDNHKTRLMKKLDVHKTVELTRLAFRYGLIGSDGAPAPSTDGHGDIPPAAR